MSVYAEKAMLVRFSVRCWNGEKTDRKTAAEVEQAKHAERGAVKAAKLLVPKHMIDGPARAARAARGVHDYMTLPWEDKGARLLAIQAYFKYQEAMSKQEEEFNRAVEKFVDQYPTIYAEAERRMGALFNRGDYPKPYDIGDKFGWEVSITPVPVGNDFRVALADDEVEEIRASIDQRVNTRLNDAIKSVWDRIYDEVGHLERKLSAYKVTVDPDTGKQTTENIFRDSTVEAVNRLAEVLPMLNIMGDPALDRMARDIKAKLCGIDATTLRENDNTRQKVAGEAKKILAAMDDFLGVAAE